MRQQAFGALLPKISHGDHCCLLFSSHEDQVQATVPFLAMGLERDERCVYVGDDQSVEALREGLKNGGINVEAEIAKNRLVLSSGRDYLENGIFDSTKMLSFLQQNYDATLGEGYTALRAAGDVSWEVGPRQDFRDVVYYESMLDIFFLGKRMVGMCQYHRDRFPPEVLSGILNTHKIAAIDQDVCQNFHYVPAEILLEKNPVARQEQRVQWMTSQLLRAQKAEEEISRINAELENRVAERTAALEAAFNDMESFSYSISHDLRAPLRAIRGFSQELISETKTVLDEDQRHLLARIDVNALRMTELIEDILEFSKVSRAEVTKTETNMVSLVQTVAGELEIKSLTLAELPAAHGDPSLLRQVYTNLLSNAAKFSRRQAQPRIEAGFKNDGQATVYYIRDNGAGFNMAHAGKLFNVFQRLHAQDEFEGTGIGLALVKKIVEKHGGRVWAEGEHGKGATFYFTLG